MELAVMQKYLEDFPGKRVAVVGDVMLDIYHRGTVERISPEAPVPVVNINQIDYHPGGAANVAMNIRSLGAKVDLFGLAGEDTHGEMLTRELQREDIGVQGILKTGSRPTTAKTRVIAGSQHVVRTDLEVVSPLEDNLVQQLLDLVRESLNGYDAIILQDYNKGLLQPTLIEWLIENGRESGSVVAVDPKFQHLLRYRGASLIKPNLKEVEQILARPVRSDREIKAAGVELMERLRPEYLLITLGARGMELFTDSEHSERLPTQARNVADVSGAGDTVISTVTLALTAGASVRDAAILGNVAAGRVCEEVGIVPITYQILTDSLHT